ncbi:hypothetical protein [Actinomadura terrae]|uniref:hypothetical protein n=1 Tax=Actinomadura terrae TaxID=604353 RepID=UPI001FA8054D|nr:hypothetical protein [Actinomadura terrae]
MYDSDPIRRLCAGIAVHQGQAVPDEAPGGRPYRRMVAAVRSACVTAGLDLALLQEHNPALARQAGGAAVLLAMPIGIDEPRAITDLVRCLDEEVVTDPRAALDPLRVVVAFDEGTTWLTDSGFEGRVVSAVCWLCTDSAAHAVLANGPERGVGVLISAPLLDDLIPPTSGPDGRAARSPEACVDAPRGGSLDGGSLDGGSPDGGLSGGGPAHGQTPDGVPDDRAFGDGRVQRVCLPDGFESVSVERAGQRMAAWAHPSGRSFRLPGQI